MSGKADVRLILPLEVEGFGEEKSSSLSLKTAIFGVFFTLVSAKSIFLDEPEIQSKD